MQHKYFIIMNPVSGTIKVEEVKNYLGKYYKSHYTLYATTAKDDIPGIVKEKITSGYKTFVAIGGDGTLSEVAEGLIGTTIPLAIIPTGTANNLAQELGIPLDTEEAIKLAAKSRKTLAIDAMQIKSKYYFLDVSIGAKSLAIRDTSRKAKLRFGIFAYLWRVTQRLIDFKPRRFTIIADGKTANYHASEVVIANAGILGHRVFRYSQTIRIDDGILHICIIRAHTMWEYLKVGYRFFRNTHAAKGHIQFITAQKTIQIIAKKDLPVQADGEIIGKRRVTVKLVPQALRVVVPQ